MLDFIKDWKKLNFDKDYLKNKFNQYAFHYEPFLLSVGKYKSWYEFYDFLSENVKSLKNDDLIYDLCCGTGLVGETLYNKGFTNVIGIDFSEYMINKIYFKEDTLNINLYKNILIDDVENFCEKFQRKAKLTLCINGMMFLLNKKKIILSILKFSDYFLFSERSDLFDYEDFLKKNFTVKISYNHDYLNLEEFKNIKIHYILIEKS